MGNDFESQYFFLRGMLIGSGGVVSVGEKGGRLGKKLEEWGADTMDGLEFNSGREILGAIRRFH